LSLWQTKSPQSAAPTFSSGSRPACRINAIALATLARHGLPTAGCRSQLWDEFEGNPISVCDSVAGEACPLYLGKAVRGHWGLPDPSYVTGTVEEIEVAFTA